MERTLYKVLLIVCALCFTRGNECQMDGIISWLVPQTISIIDTDREVEIFRRRTENIEAITSVTQGEGLNRGPYLTFLLEDSDFIISTNAAFTTYENDETSFTIGSTILFRCASGSTNTFVITVNITDTNNHSPEFEPSYSYEFTIAPPIPPGFLVTDCINDIITRDVDLSTIMIDFEVEGSSLFEISYDESSSVPKEFKAVLRAVTFIRSMPEPITLRISATDVDQTGDQPRTTIGTITIKATSEFEFPDEPIFSQAFYLATYTETNQIELQDTIYLRQGFDDEVIFTFNGTLKRYFQIDHNKNQVTFQVLTPIPPEEYSEEGQIYLVLIAEREYTSGAMATIIVQFPKVTARELKFEELAYSGTLKDNIVTLQSIVLNTDVDTTIELELNGDYSEHFSAQNINNLIYINVDTNVPDSVLLQNDYFILTLSASANNAVPTYTTIFLNIIKDDFITPTFNKNIYYGKYVDDSNIEIEDILVTQGLDETVTFEIEEEYNEYFEIHNIVNGVTIKLKSPIPKDLIFQKKVLVFNILANKPRTVGANAAVSINFPEDNDPETNIRFNQNYYAGYFQKGIVTLDSIFLDPYPDEVILDLNGEDGIIKLQRKDDIDIEFELNVLVFVLEARTITRQAHTIIILEIERDIETGLSVLKFSEPYYVVLYSESEGLMYNSEIILSDGYDETVRFALEGDDITWFLVDASENPVALVLSSPLPSEVIENNNFLVLVIRASNGENITTRSTIIIDIISDSPSGNRASFDKVLYIGQFQDNIVRHESITLLDHDGSNVHLSGDYAQLFDANTINGVVTVTPAITVAIPDSIAFIPLELNAAEANAVLLLNVIPSEQPVLPSVIFSSPLYTLRADISQTGVVGRVHATADNDEPITYTLILENEHLRERLTVNNDGEISLSAPVASGGYSFQVAATTIVNRVTASAVVSLWIDAVTTCETDIVLPPLIVIKRLEEEPHHGLVVLNQAHYDSCEYKLTNHWPSDQNWMYVDNEGLHARAIDREHESIAFMAVSQVQVEIVLYCEGDTMIRNKRSLESPSRNYSDPYDYGSKSWIITDTILYSSRRSLVNLIVIDINDNAPVFIGKENEPIYVGYPTNELEDTILPRSLVELKATDADIGENAAIVFWTGEENLAVASTTGFVHLRNTALLEDNSRFTIYAIDQNGRGLNGSIDIVVKLLDESHIAVLTIRDAFLDDEQSIITELSAALGYDVKILKAVVVSAETDTYLRKKRDADSDTGISLQLYVYGIIQNNPVNVNQLTSDITNSNLITVNIARILSLEDHLQSIEICAIPGRETALLAATISLAVLLFIIIIATALWFFLKWKKEPNYEQFNDVNSLSSQNDSIQKIPKVENSSQPRLDRDELKKSEKRLQDMLNEEKTEPIETKQVEPPQESIIDIPVLEQQLPIVIQSIDKLKDSNDDSDNDEFGEIKSNKRKTVVTFNENVEKIIHIEDRSESISSDSDCEVYKF